MPHHKRRIRFMLGLLAVGFLMGVALTASPAQAASGVGPFMPQPAWDRKLPAATRFYVLSDWNHEAVLDKETGLVWERTPDPLPAEWGLAKYLCLNRIVGNRRGWRLPSIMELASLIDPSVVTGATLPPGHPFVGIQSANYWSATSDSEVASNAFLAIFSDGSVGGGPKTDALQVWCVRGGMNAKVY
jgi:uncharacterized protein DUF1566